MTITLSLAIIFLIGNHPHCISFSDATFQGVAFLRYLLISLEYIYFIKREIFGITIGNCVFLICGQLHHDINDLYGIFAYK